MKNPNENVERYPLTWPASKARTPAHRRERAPFSRQGRGYYTDADGRRRYEGTKRLTVAQALDRLNPELERLGARYVVISSNMPTRYAPEHHEDVEATCSRCHHKREVERVDEN